MRIVPKLFYRIFNTSSSLPLYCKTTTLRYIGKINWTHYCIGYFVVGRTYF